MKDSDMPSIKTGEFIGAVATLLLLPVVFIVIGIGLFWMLVVIPILFFLAILLLRVQIWRAKTQFQSQTIEGHAVVIEERLIERDKDDRI